jgi:hypothetical protein
MKTLLGAKNEKAKIRLFANSLSFFIAIQLRKQQDLGDN